MQLLTFAICRNWSPIDATADSVVAETRISGFCSTWASTVIRTTGLSYLSHTEHHPQLQHQQLNSDVTRSLTGHQ